MSWAASSGVANERPGSKKSAIDPVHTSVTASGPSSPSVAVRFTVYPAMVRVRRSPRGAWTSR